MTCTYFYHNMRKLLLFIAIYTIILFDSMIDGVIIESPLYRIISHVSAEFTDTKLLEQSTLPSLNLVAVEPFNACEEFPSSIDFTNQIALIQRGGCNFVTKVWNAQKANASAVLVMDSGKRSKSDHTHIIMQKDENASHIIIPSVFIMYEAGEELLLLLAKATPWKPVKIRFNSQGELPRVSSSARIVSRVLAYILLVCIVCLFSSALTVLTSGLLDFAARVRRRRAMEKIPVMTYTSALEKASATKETEIGTSTGAKQAISDVCSICLEDFEATVNVKMLPCHHIYHEDCINPWLEKRSSYCPLCKHDAIASISGSKTIFGISAPFLEQIRQQENLLHTICLVLPASLVSCIIVNSAASFLRNLWP